MSYTFSPDLDRLVQEKMATGIYGTPEELLVQAIHALDELERRHQLLRDEVQTRIAKAGKGMSRPLDIESFKAAARAQLRPTE